MAKELEVAVPSVAVSGTDLAFVAYPDLVTRFAGASFWLISRILPNFCSPSTINKVSFNHGNFSYKFWYFVTKIVLTYCDKKLF